MWEVLGDKHNHVHMFVNVWRQISISYKFCLYEVKSPSVIIKYIYIFFLLVIWKVQLPPLFNIPKSHLQCFGESVYCVASDIMSRCNSGESPLDRFIAVVTWSISTVRPVIFGVAPYNPILGETHHVSRGNLNVLLEQVLFFFAFLDSFLLLTTLNNNSLKSF